MKSSVSISTDWKDNIELQSIDVSFCSLNINYNINYNTALSHPVCKITTFKTALKVFAEFFCKILNKS